MHRHRALRILGEQGILSDSELPYTRKVLKAGGTYLRGECGGIDSAAASSGVIIWRKKT